MKQIISTILAVCLSIGTASAAQEYVRPTYRAYPTSDVSSYEVYGKIEYSVSISDRAGDAKSNFKEFLRNIVVKSFGSEEGNYVVTIVAKNGGVELAKKAIYSFGWKNRNFFFFDTSSDVSSDISFSGRLVDHFPVTNNNNLIQIALQVQSTSTVAVDVTTYNKLSDQVSLLKFSTLQPALEISESLKTPLDVMASLLNTQRKLQISSDLAMSFIKNSSGYPKWVSFDLKQAGRNNAVVVNVKLETDSSIIGGFDVSTRKFNRIDLNSILPNATVGVSGAGIPFEEALNNDANKLLRDYLSSLDRGEYPTGKPPAAVCRKLWDTLQKFFTSRDAPAIYAAYLDKYDFVLDVAGAKSGCVDQYRSTMENFGVPLSNISITK